LNKRRWLLFQPFFNSLQLPQILKHGFFVLGARAISEKAA
jgi:hypothetical protein